MILAERAAGNPGEAMRSLYVLCGSATMRQIRMVGLLFRLCGTAIREGLRRLVSVMCFFVVRVSQMGVERVSSVSSSLSEVGRRLCLSEDFDTSVEVDLMCANKALEALSVCKNC